MDIDKVRGSRVGLGIISELINSWKKRRERVTVALKVLEERSTKVQLQKSKENAELDAVIRGPKFRPLDIRDANATTGEAVRASIEPVRFPHDGD